MTFLSWEKIALNILRFMQDVGSWVCIGAGIVLITAGIIFTVQKAVMTPPLRTAANLAGQRKRLSAAKPIVCFAVGGVLVFGGWAFVTELTRHAYLQVLAIVIEEDPGYINRIKSIDDIPLTEPTADKVLDAFEQSGGILADGFRLSIEKTPDIVSRMNRILVRAGLSPVDEAAVENAVSSIQIIGGSGERLDECLEEG